MNRRAFEAAATLAKRRQHLLISTADKAGVPHIASVGGIGRLADDKLVLDDWHCPTTRLNLQNNSPITLVVWDIATDTGYQMVGEVEALQPCLDTYDGELVARINKVVSFSHGRHTDAEFDEVAVSESAANQDNEACGTVLAVNPAWRSTYVYLEESETKMASGK